MPVAASHTRTVASLDAEVSSCVSGENTTDLTQSGWRTSSLKYVPVDVSHTRTVLSLDDEDIIIVIDVISNY